MPNRIQTRITAFQILAIAVVLVLLAGPAVADTYTWDASGGTAAPQDGSGTWSTSAPYWWTTSNTDVAWPAGGTDTAAFGGVSGTAGTVTVSGAGVGVGAMIFNTPDWSTYTITGGSIALGGGGPTITVNTNASIGSVLTGGAAGLVVTGGGWLELTAANTYSGPTTVSGYSILRLSNSAALPTGTNLTLDSGVIELNAGDFTGSLGSGPGQVQFTSNGGGFSAVGANRVVNLGGNSATLTWGNSSFLPDQAPLMLGTWSAGSMVDFQNPINLLDLGNGPQTVQVSAGSGPSAVNARLSGVLSGSGGLMVTGGGNLELTASNTYTGPTTVSFATLRLSNSGALPGGIATTSTGGNLTLDGGIVELNAGDFTRALGTGQGQVQFSTTNGGGFSAVGANRVVNLGGNSATLTWGNSSFLPDQAPLMLGTWAADSTIDFQNPINLLDLGNGPQTVEVTAGSGTATVNARLSGVLSGSGGLTVMGGGDLELTASNTYTGATTVSHSILRLSNSGALPGGTGATSTGSNLTLDGGVVELNAGGFTRSLGSGPGQVQFTSNGGGFSAVGANRVVNLGGNSAMLTWGCSSFLPDQAPLMLGTASGGSTIDFQNPVKLLDLGNGPQTVQVTSAPGSAAVAAQLSGVLSGRGGLTITGGGNLELTASNTYTGPTTVSGAVLRLSNSAALPSASNLTLDGGILELNAGDFTCSLGTASGQIQFTSNGGGFSAVGGNRIVNLGDNSATLTWGSSSSLPDQAPLLLGTGAADSTVDFQNPINLLDLGNGPQTVQVTAGSGTAAVDAELSGNISGSGGLKITGNGTLLLSGTDNTYSGGTIVESGTVIVACNGALPDGSSLTVGAGGTFIFDPSATAAPLAASPAAAVAAVPEPATLVLLAAALAIGVGVTWGRRLATRGKISMPVLRDIARSAMSTLPRGYDALRIVMALLLLGAAGLKAHQLVTEPVLGTGFFESRWLLITVVEFELFFGLWLVSGLLPRLTWLAAVGCFSVFASVALFKALSGAASCGCFGRLPVNPWYTASLDGMVLASLLFWRPRVAIPPGGRSKRFRLRAGLLCAAWLIAGVAAAFRMGTAETALLSDAGQVLADGKIVLLCPETWMGKRLPLLPYIDVGDELSRGEWLVVFHRRDCPKCRAALPSYVRLAGEWSRRPGAPRVAFVEIPQRGEPLSSARSALVVAGRLSAAKEWYVETPLAVTLNSGNVGRLL